MSAARIDARAPGRRELLRWAAGLGAVTADALAVRESVPLASARGRLAAAERDGTMRSWRLVRGEPALYTLTRRGLRAAEITGLSPGRVSAGGTRHAVACSSAAAALARAFGHGVVLGEPAVRRAERDRGAPYAVLGAGSGPGRAGTAHRPDLLILGAVGGDEQPVAVEVELTVKAPERLAAICRAWARSRAVSGVLYLVAEEVREPLARAIVSARAGERLIVLGLDAIA